MNKVRLSELVEFNPKRPLKKGSLAPFIEMAALPESSRDVTNIYEREYKGGGAKFTNGDTLFARITPCLENGKTAKVTGLKCGDVGHGSTEFIVMSPRNPAADEDYVYYLARLPDFRAYAQARMEGTSGRQRVSWQSLADFELQIPDAASRKRAGDILKTLDDKIQLNHQINQTLEQMAQAIFKSWFVDFEPVKAKIAALEAGGSEEDALLAAMQAISGKSANELARLQTENPEQYAELRSTAELFPSAMQESELGEIPEGWSIFEAGALIQFNPKDNLRKGIPAPYLDMASLPTTGSWAGPPILREFGSGMRFRNKDTLLARITPCLENGKTAFVQSLPDNTVGWGSTEFIVMRPSAPVPPAYAYLLARDPRFREHAIRSMTGTSGRQRVPAKSVSSFKVTAPNEDKVWRMFADLVEPIFNTIKNNAKQSETLSQTRDALLPKLLSGELSVGAAEEKLAEAAET